MNIEHAGSGMMKGSGGGPATYVVQGGDSLWLIASHLQIPLGDLIKANPSIRNINLIYSGQVLKLPPPIMPLPRRLWKSSPVAVVLPWATICTPFPVPKNTTCSTTCPAYLAFRAEAATLPTSPVRATAAEPAAQVEEEFTSLKRILLTPIPRSFAINQCRILRSGCKLRCTNTPSGNPARASAVTQPIYEIPGGPMITGVPFSSIG